MAKIEEKQLWTKVPAWAHERLRQDAEREQRSIAAQIRWIILQWYEQQDRQRSADQGGEGDR